MKTWDSDSDYMSRFPKNYTGTIGDKFCRAVRSGAQTPEEVLQFVREWVSETFSEGFNSAEQEKAYQELEFSLDSFGAREFAEHILWRENLTWEEKTALKNESQKTGANDCMKTQPPTDKQLSYLKFLGCATVPKNKLEASGLIGQFKNGFKQAA